MNPKISAGLPSLKKYYREFLFWTVSGWALHFLSFALGSALFLALIAQIRTANGFRKPLLFFFLALMGISIYTLYQRIKESLSLGVLCRALEMRSHLFKNILNAVELSQGPVRDGISKELATKVVRDTEETLRKQEPKQWILRNRFMANARRAGMIAVLILSTVVFPPHVFLTGWNRLMHGLEGELEKVLAISPEGGEVLENEPVTISVKILQGESAAPKLFIQTSIGWEEIAGEFDGHEALFKLLPITESTSFKVSWKGLESRTYVLIPIHPPRLSDFSATLSFPSYMGLEKKILKEESHFQAYRGTVVEIKARATKPLDQIEMVTTQGLRYPVELARGKNVSASLTVQNPVEFWFEMKDKDGIAPKDPVHYAVSVKEDEIPEVHLLAPSSDLLAGQEAQIPMIFEIRDDIGVRNLQLEIEQKGFQGRRVQLKAYDPSVKAKIDEAKFSLGSLKTFPGEVLRFRLEVRDNDAVMGPKSGFSEWVTVEVQSYEKEHAAIEADLEDFRKDLIDLLAQQTLANISKSEWKNASMTPTEMNQKAGEAKAKQGKVSEAAGEVEKEVQKVLKKMEKDPLSDFSVWSEHQAIQEGLESVREGFMKQAEDSLASGDFEKAAEAQENATSELERLSNLSEEVHKQAKMRDLMHSADRLMDKGEKLAQRLASTEKASEDLMKMVQETLKEVSQILAEIQKQIKDLPKELPEEFVNQPAVKEMKLDELGAALSRISDSMKRNDLQSALKAAQDLLKQAKAARDTISKAMEETQSAFESSFSEKSSESSGAIEKIISKQEEILEKTQPFEAKRKSQMLDLQKKILGNLALKQKNVLAASRALSAELSGNAPQAPYAIESLSGLGASIPKMEKVLKELTGENVIFSQKWLEEIIQHLNPGVKAQESFEAQNLSTSAPRELLAQVKASHEVGQKLSGMVSDEKSILEALRSPPKSASGAFSNEEMERMKSLGSQQSSLSQEAEKTAEEISKLGSKTAMVKPEALDSIKKANAEMKNSESALSKGESEQSVQFQEKALSHLRKGQSEMEGAGQSLQKVKRMGGQRQGGMVQPRNVPGGKSGVHRGVVKIPGVEDYLPPREFREEILESLKEKYPETQERLIKDYFKRLAQ